MVADRPHSHDIDMQTGSGMFIKLRRWCRRRLCPGPFAGAIAGFFFGTLLNTAFGLSIPAANMAFIGMAAVMAGVVEAPLMAIFLTAEMADGYQYFLALLLAAYVSFGVVKQRRKK